MFFEKKHMASEIFSRDRRARAIDHDGAHQQQAKRRENDHIVRVNKLIFFNFGGHGQKLLIAFVGESVFEFAAISVVVQNFNVHDRIGDHIGILTGKTSEFFFGNDIDF